MRQGDDMTDDRIRVGILGAGGWAKYGHIPALRSLDNFEIVAVSSRQMATAEDLAAQFAIEHAFDDYQALIVHPDVDLVVVPAPAPEHARPRQSGIAGGKDVYSEYHEHR
jgi:predicted dehydrogenase